MANRLAIPFRLPMLKWKMWTRSVGAIFGTLLILSAASSLAAFAADTSWNKIRYQGGTIDAKVNPFDWNTMLRVSANEIELSFTTTARFFGARKRVTIAARNVVALTHGNGARRRVEDALAVNSTRNPIPLFGIVAVGKDHLVGIEFRNEDGSRGAVLLAVHKSSYRELLRALSTLTSKPVEDVP